MTSNAQKTNRSDSTSDILNREIDTDDDAVDGESSEEAEAEVKEQLGLTDPSGRTDPNAEDASLATDLDGLAKVRALSDESMLP